MVWAALGAGGGGGLGMFMHRLPTRGFIVPIPFSRVRLPAFTNFSVLYLLCLDVFVEFCRHFCCQCFVCLVLVQSVFQNTQTLFTANSCWHHRFYFLYFFPHHRIISLVDKSKNFLHISFGFNLKPSQLCQGSVPLSLIKFLASSSLLTASCLSLVISSFNSGLIVCGTISCSFVVVEQTKMSRACEIEQCW